MKGKTLTYCKLIFLTVFFISCGIDSKNKSIKDDLISIMIDTLPQTEIQPQDTINEKHIIENESEKNKLKRNRENAKRINLIKNWSSVDKRALTETTKGGTAEYYYLYGQLEKIVTQQFDKTFQLFTEYYLLNGQLSFVLEKSHIYVCAFTWSDDSLELTENRDLIISDIKAAKYRETKEYFENGKCFSHSSLLTETYSPFDNEWLMTRRERRQIDFEKLMKRVKKQ